MSSKAWLWSTAFFFAAALVVSGALYARSQSANFDAHARVVAAVGSARKLNELLAKQILSARFGLTNQYDSLTRTELEFQASVDVLEERLAGSVLVDPELERALQGYRRSVDERRQVVERFKAENSVLRNSLRYLPVAVEEFTPRLVEERSGGELTKTLPLLVRDALVYNLIGDTSSRSLLLASLERVAVLERGTEGDSKLELGLIRAHARVLSERQPSVDALLQRALGTDTDARLAGVERLYSERFSAEVTRSNSYRRVLYGWSLVLLVAVAAAGYQLRRVYVGLERRVTERTRDLKLAHDALWGEMKLARKIQQALLPGSPELRGCDVAASMKPADEVGGDYYDVIREGGREWVLIGDVSGHGVPAGLIMMMCQTAVRTALAQRPDLSPGELLTIVNGVLTQNIDSLSEDKYMTISALRRDPGGAVQFAGAHQDIHVYRAEFDEVETLETSGVWLGIERNVEGMFPTRCFYLSPGDVLVLHTDGVTEARRDDTFFDTKGLRAVVERARGKSAGAILSELEAALAGFEVADDATLLVIRRLGEPNAKSA
jgi:serine phosphatase RsbU (regulator of sigma subunit)